MSDFQAIILSEQAFYDRYDWSERKRLGGGGFGEVFQVYDEHQHQHVALKLGKFDQRAGHGTSFLRAEVDFALKIPAHPNLARYEEYFVVEAIKTLEFARMRFYEHGDLHATLYGDSSGKNHTPPNFQQRLRLASGLCAGLAHLHKNSCLHRDLKPGNVLVAANPRGDMSALICDFGLGKSGVSADMSRVSNSFHGGSIWYAPYEQLAGEPVGTSADIWSLAVLLCELFTGEHPYRSGYESAIDRGQATQVAVAALLRDRHIDLELLRPKLLSGGLTAEQAQLLTAGLAQLPKNRPSALQLIKAFPDLTMRKKRDTKFTHRHQRQASEPTIWDDLDDSLGPNSKQRSTSIRPQTDNHSNPFKTRVDTGPAVTETISDQSKAHNEADSEIGTSDNEGTPWWFWIITVVIISVISSLIRLVFFLTS